MTTEEKAKAYDEVLNKLRHFIAKGVDPLITRADAQDFFPELKESDDEKIRKDIIWCLKHSGLKESNPINPHVTTTTKDAISWLEKQGEHANFFNKIQIGDKVTRNRDGVLVNLSQLNRVAKPAERQGENSMGISEATKQKLENNLNKALEKETPESWNEFLEKQGEQKPIYSEEQHEKESLSNIENRIINFAMQFHDNRMKPEAEWEDELKMLRDNIKIDLWSEEDVLEEKIEEWLGCEAFPEGTNITPLPKAMEIVRETANHFYDFGRKQQAIRNIQCTNSQVTTPESYINEGQKKGIQIVLDNPQEYGLQKPAEWSKEDEKVFHAIRNALNYEKPRNYLKSRDFEFTDILDWLKSLRPQNSWKPSDEQMKVLLSEVNAWTKGCPKQKVLESLYNDLKKLMEE